MQRKDLKIGTDYALQTNHARGTAVPLNLPRVRLLAAYESDTTKVFVTIPDTIYKSTVVGVPAEHLQVACTRKAHITGTVLVQYVGEDGEPIFAPAKRVVGFEPYGSHEQFVSVVTEEDPDGEPVPHVKMLKTARDLYMPWEMYLAKRAEAATQMEVTSADAQVKADIHNAKIKQAAERLHALGLHEFREPGKAYVHRVGNTGTVRYPDPMFVIQLAAILEPGEPT